MLAPSMRLGRHLAVLAVALAASAACAGPAATDDAPAAGKPVAPDARPRVLVFSRTAGFRHQSIPDGIAAVRQLLEAEGFAVDATEDAAAFSDANLGRYRTVVFLSTTGNVLDDAQQRAFEAWYRKGGGYAGVHAAADTEYEWPWYGQLVGAWFKGHPPTQRADIRVEDRAHQSTRMLPATWTRVDEWYAFRTNPRAEVHVLASLDEKSYQCAEARTNMGGDHPIAWYHDFDGGRAWYTALGHTQESYAEPLFREHLKQGILWASGRTSAPSAPAASPAPPAPPAPAAPSARAVAAPGTGLLAQAAATPFPSSLPVSVSVGIIGLAVVAVLGFSGGSLRQTALAWVLPGLGHVSIGERRRGLLVMGGIVGLFLTGLLVGGVDCVDSREDWPWYLPQSMNGPIAIATDAANQRLLKTGAVGELLVAPPASDPATGRPLPGENRISSLKGVGAANEFGTLLVALAGMMNLIAIMDVSRRTAA